MIFHSLHQLLKIAMFLSRCCGLLPVQGVLAHHSYKLRFKCCSLYTVYEVTVWIGLVFLMCRTWVVTQFREPNGTLSAISNSVMLRTAVPPVVLYPLFLQLSYKWPHFVRKWDLVERKLVTLKSNHKLYYKLLLFNLTAIILRFVFFIDGYYVTAVRVYQCLDLTSFKDFVDMLFYIRFPQVFLVWTPSLWKQMAMAFLELIACWSWLCCNLLILNMSLILKEKFQNFNKHLKLSKENVLYPLFWKEMRAEYCTLTQLFSITDSILSPIICATVALETMNVILFIYFTLIHSYTMISYIYFAIIYLSYSAVDSVTLASMAAVFDESRKPLRVIEKLPSSHYLLEVKRLYTQVKRDTVALSGCKFFIVTQSTILSVVSALITYEVLLVQLGSMKHDLETESGTSSQQETINTTLAQCAWLESYLRLRDA